MGPFTLAVAITSLLSGPDKPPATDPITDWIDRAVSTGLHAGVLNGTSQRNVALVAIAMFDALNTITPRYTAYRVQQAAPAGTSPDAAAAAAAHYLLIRLYPAEAPQLDSAFQAELAAIPENAHKADGIALGERVAAGLLDERKEDGMAVANPYRPVTTAGAYVPTGLPILSTFSAAKPFPLKTCDQFRPAPPYALGSAQWASDYNQVNRPGAAAGSQPTAEQTPNARFLGFGGPGTYIPVARAVVAAKHVGMLESARIFALTAVAAADALIAVM